MNNSRKILVTGTAGFIGFHFAERELKKGNIVIGVDNLNNYYDKKIKTCRLKILKKYRNFIFFKTSLLDEKFYKVLKRHYSDIYCIIHLAGQAGVRHSIKYPEEYIKHNILAYVKLLEFLKLSKKIKFIFYASSSSVYCEKNSNKKSIFLKNKPVSVYAASKISMELISNVYSRLYNKNIIGLRFFTVFGPWGRPDMSYFKFFNMASKNKTIEVYNYGNHSRSFTFIEDLINNISNMKNYYIRNFKKNQGESNVYNLGNPKTESLKKLIEIMEKYYGKKFKKKYTEKQPGDVLKTKANIDIEVKKFKFKFMYNLNTGMKKFYVWYKNYKNELR